MHTIKTDFVRLADVTVTDLIGQVGVYVIWDNRPSVVPTYIGEGNILKRLTEHASKSRFRLPFEGYIALPHSRDAKHIASHSAILEAMLLEVAAETDRWPRLNRRSGELAEIRRRLGRHALVRATLLGLDPFSPPHQCRDLDKNKRFIRTYYDGDELALDHGWRKLRQ